MHYYPSDLQCLRFHYSNSASQRHADYNLQRWHLPSNSLQRHYIGIWYKQVPEQTVVWVANRKTPLPNTTNSLLKISEDGNLVLLSPSNSSIWSTKFTSTPPPSNSTTPRSHCESFAHPIEVPISKCRKGIIAGIVVGSVVGLAAALAGVLFLMKRYERQRKMAQAEVVGRGSLVAFSYRNLQSWGFRFCFQRHSA
ncbi:hypothetical protein ACLOJK_020639 [Asimina triloba]